MVIIVNAICFIFVINRPYDCGIKQRNDILNKFFEAVNGIAKRTAAAIKVYSQKTIEYVKIGFDSLVKCAKHLASSDTSIKLSAVAASICLVAAGTVTAYGLSMDYGVSYNGEIIAYVEEKAVVDEAVQLVAEALQSDSTFEYIRDVNCVPAFAVSSKIVDASEVAQAVLDSTDEVIKCGRLIVDGKTYMCASSTQAIKSAFDARLNSFKTGVEGEVVEYLDKLEFVEGYCLKGEAVTDEQIAAVAANFSVKTTATVTYTEQIDFKTITKKTSERDTNYKRVTTSGVKGEKSVTANVVYLNGVEQSREIISEAVVKEPVNQVVVQGTAAVKSKVQKSSKAGSFIWPLAKADKQYISSYFGDGRGHKGWDICSPKGTSIYASATGTVTTAGWSTSGYGLYIIIDHGNGYSTLYSHCSELYVKVGDKVNAGETIAAVGMTGRASGNHVHFEIRINGVAQNPNRYF